MRLWTCGLVGALVQFVVDSIVLAGYYVLRPYACPVEAGNEDGLQEVAIGEVVGSGALALEAFQYGVVAQGFLGQAFALERGVINLYGRLGY